MIFARIAVLLCLPLLLLGAAPTTQPDVARSFPADWVGNWRGPCTSVPVNGKPLSFVMELNIAATDDPARFKWEIVYVEGEKRQVRPYELLVVDAGAGTYVIDEKNSIKLESTYVDGALYSQFDVMSARVTGSYRLNGDRIVVELVTTDAKKPQQTGGVGQTPPVTTYPTRAVQRAVLMRH